LIVLDAALAVLEPEAVAVRLEDVNVVSETIEQPTGKQDPGPIHFERPGRADQTRAESDQGLISQTSQSAHAGNGVGAAVTNRSPGDDPLF
jgi:hypothetical protein